MLTTFEKQLICFHGKKHYEISTYAIWFFFLFNKTVKHIISNYIPHETVTFDDRDPPGIKKNSKQFVLEKNEAYKRYV